MVACWKRVSISRMCLENSSFTAHRSVTEVGERASGTGRFGLAGRVVKISQLNGPGPKPLKARIRNVYEVPGLRPGTQCSYLVVVGVVVMVVVVVIMVVIMVVVVVVVVVVVAVVLELVFGRDRVPEALDKRVLPLLTRALSAAHLNAEERHERVRGGRPTEEQAVLERIAPHSRIARVRHVEGRRRRRSALVEEGAELGLVPPLLRLLA